MWVKEKEVIYELTRQVGENKGERLITVIPSHTHLQYALSTYTHTHIQYAGTCTHMQSHPHPPCGA